MECVCKELPEPSHLSPHPCAADALRGVLLLGCARAGPPDPYADAAPGSPDEVRALLGASTQRPPTDDSPPQRTTRSASAPLVTGASPSVTRRAIVLAVHPCDTIRSQRARGNARR